MMLAFDNSVWFAKRTPPVAWESIWTGKLLAALMDAPAYVATAISHNTIPQLPGEVTVTRRCAGFRRPANVCFTIGTHRVSYSRLVLQKLETNVCGEPNIAM